MVSMPTEHRPRSARSAKAIRLVAASLIAAVPGIIAILTDTPALGFLAIAIVLAAILAGPVLDRGRTSPPAPDGAGSSGGGH
jgi:hypothetical protein